MYNSLTFYYSNSSLKDNTTDQALSFNVPGQLQMAQDWLKIEHSQHQQWTSNLMHDYEMNYCYDMQAFVDRRRPTNSVDPFLVEFTPCVLMSSKFFYLQLTSYHAQSIFPGLHFVCPESLGFQVFEWQNFTTMYRNSLTHDSELLPQLLSRFVAWFKFSKLSFSFYVRKFMLEEDGRVSDTFSNRLMCHWLRTRCCASHIQVLHAPYMAPTPTEVHTHLKRLKEHLNRMKTVSQADLIAELNPFIHDWLSVWDLSIRWATLTYCEDRLRRLLQRWAKRRHPNKGWGWVCQKYWRVGPTASKYIFWLGVLSNVCAASNIRTTLKAHLVNLVQMHLGDCGSEVSSFTNWQFVCMDAKEGLLPYTVMSFKQWRKSRSFEHFLLY
jgi:hypothetical protein